MEMNEIFDRITKFSFSELIDFLAIDYGEPKFALLEDDFKILVNEKRCDENLLKVIIYCYTVKKEDFLRFNYYRLTLEGNLDKSPYELFCKLSEDNKRKKDEEIKKMNNQELKLWLDYRKTINNNYLVLGTISSSRALKFIVTHINELKDITRNSHKINRCIDTIYFDNFQDAYQFYNKI